MTTFARPDYVGSACVVNANGSIAGSVGAVSSVIRTGAGVYEVTLREPLTTTSTVFARQRAADGSIRCANIERVSDTLLRIRTVFAS